MEDKIFIVNGKCFNNREDAFNITEGIVREYDLTWTYTRKALAKGAFVLSNNSIYLINRVHSNGTLTACKSDGCYYTLNLPLIKSRVCTAKEVEDFKSDLKNNSNKMISNDDATLVQFMPEKDEYYWTIDMKDHNPTAVKRKWEKEQSETSIKNIFSTEYLAKKAKKAITEVLKDLFNE